jgi:Trk-type K+ transport system membrane component
LLLIGLRSLRLHEVFAERKVSPGAVMMITFGALIIAGTLMLLTPRATTAGISVLDAGFTAISAVCVTGLTVVDTETAITPFGKVILLCLFQAGGLGVMTLTTFLAQAFGGVSLRGRVLLQDLISEENVGHIGRMLLWIVGITLTTEAIGAWWLFTALEPTADVRGSHVFVAVFHSVSAFCNAGFSTWSGGLYDPVVRTNTGVQVVIMLLIVAGGMGFPVLVATFRWLRARVAHRWLGAGRKPRLSVHARLAWITTGALILGGALLIGVAEYVAGDQVHHTPAVVASLFHSITARTAGFNIAPVEAMTPAAISVIILLMFIGGCPAGTAGGVRTTAFAVALLNVRRIVLGRRDVEAFGRRIPEEVVSRAMAVMILSIGWLGAGTTLLALFEPHVPLSSLVFEMVSALSTVGLTRGVTPELGTAGKLVIMLTMFAGRIGLLYFVFAFLGRPKPPPFRVPEENVYVT